MRFEVFTFKRKYSSFIDFLRKVLASSVQKAGFFIVIHARTTSILKSSFMIHAWNNAFVYINVYVETIPFSIIFVIKSILNAIHNASWKVFFHYCIKSTNRFFSYINKNLIRGIVIFWRFLFFKLRNQF